MHLDAIFTQWGFFTNKWTISNKSFVIPELFFRIWWRRQKWCGRCSPCPVGLCRVWGSCATCSSLDLLIPADTQKTRSNSLWENVILASFIYYLVNYNKPAYSSVWGLNTLVHCWITAAIINRIYQNMSNQILFICKLPMVGLDYWKVMCWHCKSSSELRPAK